VDCIYLVRPREAAMEKVEPVLLEALGFTEPSDLEQWILSNMEVLGENLLALTNQFSQFEVRKRKVDILALDANGKLVVVELKLHAEGSFADLQAVYYAAMCSTMKMGMAVDALSRFRGISREAAADQIRGFLRVEQLPELDSKPRIILAANSFDDQELTGAVLWLRSFNVDATCVELTPYKLPDYNRLVLVPRVIIPPPEAKNYMARVSAKESSMDSGEPVELAQLREAIAHAYEENPARFGLDRSHGFLGVSTPEGAVFYEWVVRKRPRQVDVGVYFTWMGDAQRNQDFIKHLAEHEAEIRAGTQWTYNAGQGGYNGIWTYARFCFPYDTEFPSLDRAAEYASAMTTLIERTWPLIEAHLQKEKGKV